MALKPKQIACIELMIEHPSMTVCALADAVGVNRNTVSQWRRNNPEFQNEYARRLKDKWKDTEGIAVDTMRELAINGDFKASKYILDSLGYAPAQKVEADVNSKNEINITIGDTDEN